MTFVPSQRSFWENSNSRYHLLSPRAAASAVSHHDPLLIKLTRFSSAGGRGIQSLGSPSQH